jgi:predicted ATP-grasp superfamily ATP-dependent carboligase
MSRTVIVTDGEQRAALAVVRSLGRAGWRSVVCSTVRKSLAGGSRFAHVEAIVPDPLITPGAFADAVAGLARSHRADLVLPIAEPAMLAILDARQAFSGARLPFPSVDVFRAVSNKGLLLNRAASAGLAVPTQTTLTGPGDLGALDRASLAFPLVLKPVRSVAEADGGRISLRVAHARDRAELHRHLAQLPAAAFPLLLQQRIVGPGVGVFLLLWEGDCRGVFAHRRILEKPPSGGVSVYREAIAAEPELVRRSRALLESLGWTGVAMVEFKIEAATGQPYLMEVNGRFWGSLQLAIDAGVDFPALLAEAALGLPAREPPPYRVGVRSRWSWGVVDHLLARLRSTDRELGLPPGSRSRTATIGMALASLARGDDRDEVFRLKDPKPFFRESLAWLRGR